MNSAQADTSFSMAPLAVLHQHQQSRLQVLDFVKGLLELVRVVQQHRAATNGALAGNPFFESKTRAMAREVNARLKELDRIQKSIPEFANDFQWHEIKNAWQTVHLQWCQDEVIENFELHSHLVKQMLDYVAELGINAESLIQSDFAHQALGNYVYQQLPNFIELLGQVRALGTSAAVVGRVDHHSEMRLKFLMGQLQKQQEKVKEEARRFSQEAMQLTSSLIDALLCEPKLERLNGIVKNDFLSGRDIVTSADEVFTLSTSIIDAHYKVMSEGLRLLRLSMDTRMMAWISR